jgi:hypothetical protein
MGIEVSNLRRNGRSYPDRLRIHGTVERFVLCEPDRAQNLMQCFYGPVHPIVYPLNEEGTM